MLDRASPQRNPGKGGTKGCNGAGERGGLAMDRQTRPPAEPCRYPSENNVRHQRQSVTPNPYSPTEFNTPVNDTICPSWSFEARVFFLLASLPAILLPIAYLTGAGWMVVANVTGTNAFSERPIAVSILLWTGIYATYIQLPIYMIWTLVSHELTVRQRVFWFSVVFLLNMFTIPAFLYAKYRGRTVEWISRSDRKPC